ncbi:hypothetical protein [Profundibacter sp.]
MAILSTTKLDIYNGALRRLGSRSLASLTENRKPRRVLDDIWGDDDKVVRRALRKGSWNFAMRSSEIVYETSVAPDFGFKRAFIKPTDLLRLNTLAADEYMRSPLVHSQFIDEAGYWFSDYDTLYIGYVSSDGAYGFDDTIWPEEFKEYIALILAFDAVEAISNSKSKKQMILAEMNGALKSARSLDSMSDGVKFPPAGSWLQSRGGYGRRERSRLG